MTKNTARTGLLALVVASLALAGCGGGGSSSSTTSPSSTGGAAAGAGDAAAGKKVFADNCSTCHGPDGRGGGGGPDLTTMPLAQSMDGAVKQVTDGGGGMPAFGGRLSPDEIQDVAAYVVKTINGK